MSVIVDSSVATKWVADEPSSDRARALFLAEECWAPNLIIAEVGNALWKKRRMNIVTVEQAMAALAAVPSRLVLFETTDLAPRAVQIAVELDHPIYDCFYLALAELERVPRNLPTLLACFGAIRFAIAPYNALISTPFTAFAFRISRSSADTSVPLSCPKLFKI